MKATELLEQQHRAVEDLFEELADAETPAEKREIFERLAASLVGHDAIERELFYPACEKELGAEDDVLGESLVEHGVVEFCLFRADQNQGSDDFDKYVTVLEEAVEHHVKEEETGLFPKVKGEMDADELEELGAKMEARFNEALESDFRQPLRDNLDQVLAGKTKTQKKAPPRAGTHKPNARAKASSTETRSAKRRRAPALAKHRQR
jgi:hemerythrin superfamily protein